MTHVNKDRPIVSVANVLEDRKQLIEVVAINDADVIKTELLEQRAAGHKTTRQFFGERRLVLDELWQMICELPAEVAQRHVRPGSTAGARDNSTSRPLAARSTFVVVQDYDQAAIHRAGIVHGFIGHARRYRAVADDADNVMVALWLSRARPPYPIQPISTSRNAPRQSSRIRSQRAW